MIKDISILIVLCIAVGCTTPPDPTAATATVKPAVTSAVKRAAPAAQFTATFDAIKRTLIFKPLLPVTKEGIHAESINSVPAPSGVDGNPAANNVDLVTTSCSDPWPTEDTFSCDVKLVSGFTHDVANLYVQVSNATLDGGVTDNYDAINSDSEVDSTNNGAIAVAHGLWGYTNSAMNPDAIWPVVGAADGGFNTATRTWTFFNPANQNVVYTIVVWATEYWGTYEIAGSNGDNTYGNMGYTDACDGGTAVTGGSEFSFTLPFNFVLWNTDSTTINVCPSMGEVTLGSTACVSALTSPAGMNGGPITSVPSPAFWPFWDRLKYGSAVNDQSPSDPTQLAGRVCYQTVGSAPNQMEVIEWRNFDFSNAPDEGASLNFELFLYQGTNEIDLDYYSMNPAHGDNSGRETGTQAWVGTQGRDNSGYNSGSTALTSSGAYASGGLGSGNAYTFLPQP